MGVRDHITAEALHNARDVAPVQRLFKKGNFGRPEGSKSIKCPGCGNRAVLHSNFVRCSQGCSRNGTYMQPTNPAAVKQIQNARANTMGELDKSKSMKPGGGGRFAALTAKLGKKKKGKKKVRNPGALAAYIGDRKYGKKQMSAWAHAKSFGATCMDCGHGDHTMEKCSSCPNGACKTGSMPRYQKKSLSVASGTYAHAGDMTKPELKEHLSNQHGVSSGDSNYRMNAVHSRAHANRQISESHTHGESQAAADVFGKSKGDDIPVVHECPECGELASKGCKHSVSKHADQTDVAEMDKARTYDPQPGKAPPPVTVGGVGEAKYGFGPRRKVRGQAFDSDDMRDEGKTKDPGDLSYTPKVTGKPGWGKR